MISTTTLSSSALPGKSHSFMDKIPFSTSTIYATPGTIKISADSGSLAISASNSSIKISAKVN